MNPAHEAGFFFGWGAPLQWRVLSIDRRASGVARPDQAAAQTRCMRHIDNRALDKERIGMVPRGRPQPAALSRGASATVPPLSIATH